MDDTGTPPPGPPPVSPTAATDTLDLKGKVDRFGDLLAKSMELAEVGMNLSLSIISTVGAAAQQKIVQKLAESTETAAAAVVPQHAAPPPEQADYGITNRLALAPGGIVGISFSVNNDAATGPKQVSLQVESFAGDQTGSVLPPGSLSVSPPSGAIAPMDFEKFVLSGMIPPDTAPDVYRGAVAVVSDTVIRIPVWLVVRPSQPPT